MADAASFEREKNDDDKLVGKKRKYGDRAVSATGTYAQHKQEARTVNERSEGDGQRPPARSCAALFPLHGAR